MTSANEAQPDTMTAVDISSTAAGGEGAWLVTIDGEIDVASSPLLREELVALIDGGARSIVLDLHNLTFIDSSGLGVLVGALKRLRERAGGSIMMRGMQDSVRRVFEITGLTELFTIEA